MDLFHECLRCAVLPLPRYADVAQHEGHHRREGRLGAHIVAQDHHAALLLLDAHQRLSMLPHINTHPTYEPHITLGYVHETFAGYAIERLEHLVLEQQLTVRVSGINYGDRLS